MPWNLEGKRCPSLPGGETAGRHGKPANIPYDFAARRRVTSSAKKPRPHRIDPASPPLVLQHPPPPCSAPGQQTPFMPPVSRQPNPPGHLSFIRSHGTTHTICVPSL